MEPSLWRAQPPTPWRGGAGLTVTLMRCHTALCCHLGVLPPHRGEEGLLPWTPVGNRARGITLTTDNLGQSHTAAWAAVLLRTIQACQGKVATGMVWSTGCQGSQHRSRVGPLLTPQSAANSAGHTQVPPQHKHCMESSSSRARLRVVHPNPPHCWRLCWL
jgi:hypothetical protein